MSNDVQKSFNMLIFLSIYQLELKNNVQFEVQLFMWLTVYVRVCRREYSLLDKMSVLFTFFLFLLVLLYYSI